MKPIRLPDNAIEIATGLRHPADNNIAVWTLVRYGDRYAMVDLDGVTQRTVDRRWAAGVELRTIRKQLGLTQAAFAERLHTSPNNVARWERGEVRILGPTLVAARMLLKKDASHERNT